MGRPRGLTLNPSAFDDLRRQRGLTQLAVAQQAEISAPHLNEMVRGGKGATADVAERVASVLGVAVATLFPESGAFRAVRFERRDPEVAA
jgi:transcriptional regulator with XRE-family HTH domain